MPFWILLGLRSHGTENLVVSVLFCSTPPLFIYFLHYYGTPTLTSMYVSNFLFSGKLDREGDGWVVGQLRTHLDYM